MRIAIIAAYFMVLIVMGYAGMRKTKSVGDFFLGGRTIGPWISAFAYGTTYFSAVLFIGFAGKVGWGYGWGALWVVVGNTILGSFLAWVVLARRTRSMSQRLGAMTLPEFLGARYGSRALKMIAAVVIFFFLVPYSGSVYIGLSHLFELTLGMPYALAVVLIAGITAVFLVVGGYHAVTLTDFLLGAIMLVGAVLLVAFIASAAGGWHAMSATMTVKYAQHVPQPRGFWGLAPLVLLTSLGPWGMPQMVQKFYAIKSVGVIKTAVIVSTLFALIITFSAYFSGALTHVFFDAVPQGNPDLLMPTLIERHVPGWLGSILLLLVLAASMSTLSSLVLVSSSSLAIDMYGELRPVRGRGMMLLLRALCAVFVALSVVIALIQPAMIVSLMSISWGTVAGAFLSPYVFGLFWRRTTRWGALAGMLCGICLSVGLFLWWGKEHTTEAGVVAMLASLVAVPLVSLLTRPLPAQQVELVFGEARGSQPAAAREVVA